MSTGPRDRRSRQSVNPTVYHCKSERPDPEKYFTYLDLDLGSCSFKKIHTCSGSK